MWEFDTRIWLLEKSDDMTAVGWSRVYPHQVRCTPSRLLWGAGASYHLTPATLPNDPACLAQLAFEFPSPVAQTLIAQLSFFISNQLSRLSLFQ